MKKTATTVFILAALVFTFTLTACSTPAPAPIATPNQTGDNSSTTAPEQSTQSGQRATDAVKDNTPDSPDSDQPQKPTVTITTEAVPAYKIFLIAMEDEGKNGKAIGCGDSAIAVDGAARADLTQLSPTRDRMKAAYEQLFAAKNDNLGQAGYRNFLAGSKLQLDDLLLSDGKVLVKLGGNLVLNGTCDNPRVEAQLVETALQFPEVSEVTIMLNGTALQDYLSLKGS